MAAGFAPDGWSPTYQIAFSGLAPTAAMDLASVLYPAAAPVQWSVVRLRRVVISNPGAQTGAALVNLALGYAGNALGSGGTSLSNVRPFDQMGADPDLMTYAISHTGDSTPAAGFVQVATVPIWVPAAVAVATPAVFDFGGPPFMLKAVTVPAAKALVLRHPGVAGAASLSGYILITADAA